MTPASTETVPKSVDQLLEEIEVLRARLEDMERERDRAVRAESALHECQRALVTLISNLPGVAYTARVGQGRVIDFVSEGAAALTGIELPELIGSPLDQLIHPDDISRVASAMGDALERRVPVNMTYRLKRPDGGIRFIHDQGRGVWNDEMGTLEAVEGVLTDITAQHLAEKALRDSEERLALAETFALVMVLRLSPDGVLKEPPPRFAELLGYPRRELQDLPMDDLLHPDDRTGARAMRARLRNDRRSNAQEMEVRFVCRDGVVVWTYVTMLLIRDVAGQPVHFTAYLRDITARKQAEEAQRQSPAPYELASQMANDGLWDWNLKTNTIVYSPRWKAMLGFGETEVGTSLDEWFQRIHPADVSLFHEALHAHLAAAAQRFEQELRVRHKDGTWRWMLCRGIAVRDSTGRAVRMAGSLSDITERRRLEQRLLHDTIYDPLTGLPNRVLLEDRLEQAMARLVHDTERPFAILYLNIDRFKMINETLGHRQGDELLLRMAERLKGTLAAGDTMARPGTDEFILLLAETRTASDAARAATRLREVLRPPFLLSGTEAFITVSVGIALVEQPGTGAEELIRRAEMAMYRAKSDGRDAHAFFDREQHGRAMALIRTESELRRAIEQNEFQLHYQPIVSLRDDGRLSGFEALVRWNHPERGLLGAAEFVPVADACGLIGPLTDWVLEQACQQVAEWRRRHPILGDLTISVNISPRQLVAPDLAQRIEAPLRRSGLPPHLLGLEITEGAFLSDGDAALRALASLRELRVHTLIDDFGTGYSSLGFLARYPVDVLKIDREFVQTMDIKHEHFEIVRLITGLAHSLGLQIVAEGIETERQASEVKRLQCQYGQGFLFAAPMPADAALRYLEEAAAKR